MNAAAKKATRVFWTERERAEWRAAVEAEAAPRPDGTFASIVEAAMKRMARPRPTTHLLISEAGEWIRALRKKSHHVPDPRAPSEPVIVRSERESGTAPAVTPAPTIAPQPESAPPPAATNEELYDVAPRWTESLIEELVHVLTETIVRTAESPAVRKALRSAVQIATSRDFRPEVDNTVPWEAPAVGPRLPRVLVVGFHRPGPVRAIVEQFGAKLDLRFWRVDYSMNQLRQDLLRAEHVIILTGGLGHSAYQLIGASNKPYVTLPMAGKGLLAVARELQRIVDERRRTDG